MTDWCRNCGRDYTAHERGTGHSFVSALSEALPPRQIDADAVIRYLDFLDGVQTFHWVPPSMARAEVLKQMRDFIEALSEPQPTFREIEAAS